MLETDDLWYFGGRRSHYYGYYRLLYLLLIIFSSSLKLELLLPFQEVFFLCFEDLLDIFVKSSVFEEGFDL